MSGGSWKLEDIVEAVEKKMQSLCHAESDTPMPEVAQKLHGRQNYVCGRDKGHEGKHYWPGHGHNLLAEWGDSDDQG